jgi:TrmH family RNA methyltransferase
LCILCPQNTPGMKQLTSRDNPLFKSILRLVRSSRARREEGRIVLDGIHLVHAYLDRFGPQGVELVVKRGAAGHPEILALQGRAPAVTMSDSLFDQAAPVQSPVGILALAPIPRPPAKPVEPGFQVLLDGIQDPGNLGAILRSAAASGGTIAHLSGSCADAWSPKALRGGMGAQFLVEIRQHPQLATVAASLGVRLIACAADAKASVFESELNGELAFIIGGEGKGISDELLANAHQSVRIPMRPGIESLNAGAAAAICFYEWGRQNRISRHHP